MAVLMPVTSAWSKGLRGIRVGWKVMGMTVAATSVPACWVRPPIPALGDRLPISSTSVLVGSEPAPGHPAGGAACGAPSAAPGDPAGWSKHRLLPPVVVWSASAGAAVGRLQRLSLLGRDQPDRDQVQRADELRGQPEPARPGDR